MPFIDFHTHKISNQENVISIFNVVWGKDKIPTNEFFSLGIHPWFIPEFIESLIWDELIKTAKTNNCLALGEIGLDRIRGGPIENQLIVFRKQIEIAKELNKPIIIHSVKTHSLIAQELKKSNFNLPVIFHGFNQSINIQELLKEENFYFSIGKSIFSNKGNNSRDTILRYFPKKIFFETDDSNNSISEIYSKASEILKIDEKIVVEAISNNFKSIFGNIFF